MTPQIFLNYIFQYITRECISDVEFFAQPEGCTVLGPQETLPKESVNFVFMLTDVKNNVKRSVLYSFSNFCVLINDTYNPFGASYIPLS